MWETTGRRGKRRRLASRGGGSLGGPWKGSAQGLRPGGGGGLGWAGGARAQGSDGRGRAPDAASSGPPSVEKRTRVWVGRVAGRCRGSRGKTKGRCKDRLGLKGLVACSFRGARHLAGAAGSSEFEGVGGSALGQRQSAGRAASKHPCLAARTCPAMGCNSN